MPYLHTTGYNRRHICGGCGGCGCRGWMDRWRPYQTLNTTWWCLSSGLGKCSTPTVPTEFGRTPQSYTWLCGVVGARPILSDSDEKDRIHTPWELSGERVTLARFYRVNVVHQRSSIPPPPPAPTGDRSVGFLSRRLLPQGFGLVSM